MPYAAQLISEYWPLTQFVKFSQDILFRGAGIEIVWGHMLIMGCIGVGFLWLALLRFQGCWNGRVDEVFLPRIAKKQT